MSEHLHDVLVREAVAAFYLPDYAAADDFVPAEAGGNYDDEIAAQPFPCIRIVRKTIGVGPERIGWHLLDDIVCRKAGEEWGWAQHLTIHYPTGERRSAYYPEAGPVTAIAMPKMFLALIEALADRKNGYIEQAVTRQQRRALGVTNEYREYIVVRRPNPGCFTIGAIIRRHPQLHAVRGHLRHYKSGRVAVVRPHMRGHGELAQVKDYAIV